MLSSSSPSSTRYQPSSSQDTLEQQTQEAILQFYCDASNNPVCSGCTIRARIAVTPNTGLIYPPQLILSIARNQQQQARGGRGVAGRQGSHRARNNRNSNRNSRSSRRSTSDNRRSTPKIKGACAELEGHAFNCSN